MEAKLELSFRLDTTRAKPWNAVQDPLPRRNYRKIPNGASPKMRRIREQFDSTV